MRWRMGDFVVLFLGNGVAVAFDADDAAFDLEG